MERNKNLRTLSGSLLVIVMIALLAPPGAWAQSKFKTLHKFTDGRDGEGPSGLAFDAAVAHPTLSESLNNLFVAMDKS